MFEKIKRYYDKHFYTNAHIAAFVQAGVLAAVEYTAITGQAYEV